MPPIERRIVLLKPVQDNQYNTIFIEMTPQDFATVAGMMFSSIPSCAPGGTLMIESGKDNLFFKFVEGENKERMIQRRSLIGE